MARLRTRRSGVRVGDNGSQADVLHDAVALVEGQQVLRTWDELEIELLPDADERSLGQIAKLLRRAGARPGDERPKLAQALEAEAPEPARRRPGTTGQALQLAFAEQLARIVRHDPGARLGDDAEDVHQMRVATRRLRAFLRAARAVAEPRWADELRAELRWLADALGPVRDLDVLLDYLRARVTFTTTPISLFRCCIRTSPLCRASLTSASVATAPPDVGCGMVNGRRRSGETGRDRSAFLASVSPARG